MCFLFGNAHISQNQWTPLMIASQNGHIDVVNMLLKHGASVHLEIKVNYSLEQSQIITC